MLLVHEIAYATQTTYWRKSGNSGFGDVYDAPIIINAKWDEIIEDKSAGAYKPSGDTIVSNAIIYTPSRLEAQGYVFRGVSAETNPAHVKGAYIIRYVSEFKSISGEVKEYTARL